MKQIYLFTLMLLITFASCKKEEIEELTQAEQQAYADSVIAANNTPNTNTNNNNTGNTGTTYVTPITECGVSWKDSLSYGTVTDIDGNVYNTIVIGTQEWMAENLAVTSFNDGTSITQGVNALAPYFPAYLKPNDTLVDCYGLLYNLTVVENSNVCPVDWHVPDSTEWTILFDHALPYDNGPNALGINKVLQSIEGWTFVGKDVLGFRMLPAGSKDPWDVNPTDVGDEAYMWSSTFSDATHLRAIKTGPYTHDGKVLDLGSVHDHKSIRCIKD